MGETEIGWTHRPNTVGRTWNPVQGCRRISPGCQHCYAERLAARFAETGWSKGLIDLKTRKWNGNARLANHKLGEPFGWANPATVFVNSMSDLFYDGFSFEEIAAVFGVMWANPQHTFQILTKRAKRMREWFRWIATVSPELGPIGYCVAEATAALPDHRKGYMVRAAQVAHEAGVALGGAWPLPNVWIGTSSENQETAEERIPDLLATPAAVHFISAEPLIGGIDLTRIGQWQGAPLSALEEIVGFVNRPPLSWVVIGCESGPGARDCDNEWVRTLVAQCAAQRVPVFLKQLMAHTLDRVLAPASAPAEIIEVTSTANRWCDQVAAGPGSKRKGGGLITLPYLDGVQHGEFPRHEPRGEPR